MLSSNFIMAGQSLPPVEVMFSSCVCVCMSVFVCVRLLRLQLLNDLT